MEVVESKIKTFIFMDCESTGLPAYEQNVKITELSLVAILSADLLIKSEVLPRVVNKLTLCFNPGKPISEIAMKITGLTNISLHEQSMFTNNTVVMLNAFLQSLPQPACLVAHNGNRFDYPLLKKHVKEVSKKALYPSLLCIDSLLLFRREDQEQPPQEKKPKLNESQPFKLTTLYERKTGKETNPNHAHQSDYDVFMLIMSAASCGEGFLRIANEMAIPFKNIKPLKN